MKNTWKKQMVNLKNREPQITQLHDGENINTNCMADVFNELR